MNLLDCYVTKVLGDPYYVDSFDVKWRAVDVEYKDGWFPGVSASTRTFKTKEEAEAVKEGFHFLA